MTAPTCRTLTLQKTRQTDYRFADLEAWDRDRNKMRPTINVWGCLFFSLASIAEDFVGLVLSVSEKRALLQELLRMHATNKHSGMSPTCYVKNHEDVLNQALHLLGSNARGRYVFIDRGGNLVYPYDHSARYEGKVNARIEQWKVDGSASHFIHTDLDGTCIYDPYPQLPLVGRMSVRGYYVGES